VPSSGPAPTRSVLARWAWFAVGWVAVGLGSVGILVPGLPTTVFFIVAASCFAKSSPRLERWVLDLPHVGPLVRDYRAGLGMPRRAKQWAAAMIVVFAGLSAVAARNAPLIAIAIGLLGAVGLWYVIRRVPTRERILGDH
jgi:uncharacterized protein